MNNSVVIIPTYNEKKNITPLLEALVSLKGSLDIVVVDDSSPDGTASAVKDFSDRNPIEGIYLILRPSKSGLGSAYLEGFDWVAQRSQYEKIFMMDADFSHNPKYIQKMAEILDHDTDMVVGSRYVTDGGVCGWPLTRKLISRLGNFYARLVTGLVIKDLTSGFIGMKKKVLENILASPPRSEGYGFLIELKHKTLHAGFSIVELPIIFTDRTVGKSKISRRIIWEAFWLMWRLRLFGLRTK